MKTIKVFEAFAGYGSQLMALKRLQANYSELLQVEAIGISEIDKYAIQAYKAIHGEVKNYGNISKIDWSQVPDFDLFTYSSPCQDFSQAGLQRGGEQGSGTRSSLLWECERAIAAKRPKYLLMENVSALVSQKFIKLFNRWQVVLQGYGYKNFAKVLNAKDYGVPQNRERIFLVSILDDEARYEFPQPFTLEKRLKDVLEQNVDERYYLSDERIAGLLASMAKEKEAGRGYEFAPKTGADTTANSVTTNAGGRKTDNFIAEPRVSQIGQLNAGQSGRVYDSEHLCPTIDASATDHSRKIKIAEPCVQQIGCLYDNNAQAGRVYDTKGISPTLDDMSSGGSKEPKIALKEQSIITPPHGYFKGAENTETSPCVKVSAMQGQNFVKEQICIGSMQKNAYKGSTDGVSPCINSACGMGGGQTPMVTDNGIRVRKLTERELFRLMDVSEPDIDILLNAGISKTQLAKMAGNSIVVACLYHIFDRMFIHTEPTEAQLRLF